MGYPGTDSGKRKCKKHFQQWDANNHVKTEAMRYTRAAGIQVVEMLKHSCLITEHAGEEHGHSRIEARMLHRPGALDPPARGSPWKERIASGCSID